MSAAGPVLVTGFEPFDGRSVNASWAAVEALVATKAVPATVATAGLADAKERVRPAAGAGDESVAVSICTTGPLTVMGEGDSASVAPTFTAWLAEPYPAAEAVTAAVP